MSIDVVSSKKKKNTKQAFAGRLTIITHTKYRVTSVLVDGIGDKVFRGH